MSLNSLFTGLSGIQVHQTRTNVVADNIANINTTGFKTLRANFEELLAQTIEAATRPQGSTSGTNPVQAGTGVRLKSIDTNFAQGTIATTDRAAAPPAVSIERNYCATLKTSALPNLSYEQCLLKDIKARRPFKRK